MSHGHCFSSPPLLSFSSPYLLSSSKPSPHPFRFSAIAIPPPHPSLHHHPPPSIPLPPHLLCSSSSSSSSSSSIPQPPFHSRPPSLDDWDKTLPPDHVRLLAKFRSAHNLVRVLDVARCADHPVAGARILLLDRPGNIQSLYNPFKVLTDSYYDVFATLPPLIPHGAVGVLGLGAGTAARLLLHFWPELEVHGWEIDPAVIAVARKYFDLSELEEGKVLTRDVQAVQKSQENYISATDAVHSLSKDYTHRGKLVVHTGDALGADAVFPGGFAGILVDLFAEGAAISALQCPETWQHLRLRLAKGGRIMVNCGGSCVEGEGADRKDGRVIMEQTLKAITTAFPGEVWKKDLGVRGDSTVALTGPAPDLQVWTAALPEKLRANISEWEAVV